MGIKRRPHACKTRTLWSDLSSAPTLRSSKFFSLFLSVSCMYTLYYEHNILVRKSLWGWREITHKVWRGRAGVRVELTPVIHFQKWFGEICLLKFEGWFWGRGWNWRAGRSPERGSSPWGGSERAEWEWFRRNGIPVSSGVNWGGWRHRFLPYCCGLYSEAGAWLMWQWPGALRRACGV